MRFATQQLLRSGHMRFASTFVSSATGTQEDICSQLKAYKFVDTGNPDDIVMKRRKLSGKGGGKNDDLSIALQMLAYWPSMYFDQPTRARIA
jgi:hypothetical protein